MSFTSEILICQDCGYYEDECICFVHPLAETKVFSHDTPKFKLVKKMFSELDDVQREKIMAEYCEHCGSNDPFCQCNNDE